jgi:methylenetetrahydrofolate reductase (NADPH)
MAAVPTRLSATAQRGPSVSFELYPPRSPAAAATLWDRTIPALLDTAPDFLSVTYGASGSSRDASREVVRHIAERSGVAPVAHLTCIGAPRDELVKVAQGFMADGVRDFLALRGDPPAGAKTWTQSPDGLQRASELVELLRDLDPALGIGAAASPSCLTDHVHEPTGCGDLLALKAKQDAGAQYAITQVFFDSASYRSYVETARAAGVHLPIVPGLVPLSDPVRLRRLEEISGVPVPKRILAALDAEPDETRRNAAGLAMGAELVESVLASGAPGVHLYTFNQAPAALALLDRIGLRRGIMGG